MKIAICDDDQFYLTAVKQVMDEYLQLPRNREVAVSYFVQSEELLESAGRVGGYDIYILDIVMPDLDGIELARKIRKTDETCAIIFLTSSDLYAIEAFEVRAYRYLLKPVKKEKLFPVLDEIADQMAVRQENCYLLKTKSSYIRINCDSIMYAELSGRRIVFHLINGSTVESTSVRIGFEETLHKLLQNKQFFMCGKGMMANLHHITAIEKDAVVFREIFRHYLPAKVCNEVRAAWIAFWFGKEELSIQ